jgi:hypothetical protein
VSRYRDVDYTDALLADGTAHRRFSDGREEWRHRVGPTFVQWRDNQGASGTDEALGARLVKRTFANGQAVYGRELGYGRTVWGNGTLTRNRTSFGGRMGLLLTAIGAAALLGTVVPPPLHLSLAEEEELRRQAQLQQQGSGSDGGSDGDDGYDWSDHDGGHGGGHGGHGGDGGGHGGDGDGDGGDFG